MAEGDAEPGPGTGHLRDAVLELLLAIAAHHEQITAADADPDEDLVRLLR